MSVQGYAERPDGSMMALIESLQATVDVLVEDAAAGFGNLETRYQPQPTQPDLKTFGDRHFALEQNLLEDPADASQGPVQATIDEFGAVKKLKWQEKILPSDYQTGGGSGDITNLSFSNLTIGKTYRAIYQLKTTVSSATNTHRYTVYDGAGGTGNILGRIDYDELESSNQVTTRTLSFIFTAQSTLINLRAESFDATDALNGDGTKGESFAQLEELPNHEVTTDWT